MEVNMDNVALPEEEKNKFGLDRYGRKGPF